MLQFAFLLQLIGQLNAFPYILYFTSFSKLLNFSCSNSQPNYGDQGLRKRTLKTHHTGIKRVSGWTMGTGWWHPAQGVETVVKPRAMCFHLGSQESQCQEIYVGGDGWHSETYSRHKSWAELITIKNKAHHLDFIVKLVPKTSNSKNTIQSIRKK